MIALLVIDTASMIVTRYERVPGMWGKVKETGIARIYSQAGDVTPQLKMFLQRPDYFDVWKNDEPEAA